MRIATTSRGIKKISNLAAFFDEKSYIELYKPYYAKKYQLMLGWGNKPSSLKTKAIAEKHNIPFLRLEDGFLRSLGPAGLTPLPLAIVCDDRGIYYDAQQPSQLEQLIIDNKLSDQEEKRALHLINQIKTLEISKYNHASYDPDFDYEDYVLVIDQTYNDLSVIGGMANSDTFRKMLDCAIEHNPNRRVIVKTHPEVVSGLKQGYLEDLSLKSNCIIYHKLINPWQLLRNAAKVYTVTSQLGFEAIMAGKEVHCFGMPFYAGWGLTIDYQTCSRRNITKTLSEVFDAAYLKYSRYYDPFSNSKCEIEQVIALLARWRHINEENKPIRHAVYFSKWKQKAVAQFFYHTDGNLTFYRNFKKAVDNVEKNVLAWASKLTKEDIEYAKQKGVTILRVEDGFLRSVGLGANLVTPQSLVLDDIGIYYDATHPSKLEQLLNNGNFDAILLERARKLISLLQTSGVTKYNLKNKDFSLALPQSTNKILVVGQVEDDASIKMGSTEIKTNLSLLQQVRQNNPEAYIIYKPHPDVVAGQRKGHIPLKEVMQYANLLEDNTDIDILLQHVDELHTITSLSGFEALIRNKKVYCYGMPFYAGWGLTIDVLSNTRRNVTLTLEELVAAALILYPRYLDPITRLWCTPEIIIDRLNEINPYRESGIIKIRKMLGKIRKMFR